MVKKSKTSKSHKAAARKHKMMSSKSLGDLIVNTMNSRKDLTKSETNLPAKLLAMNMANRPIRPIQQSYSKSVSSTYSSSMHNGEVHSEGKQIVNDSTKPFIQVAEMHNGQVENFMIPRNQSPHSSNPILHKGKTVKRTKHTQQLKQLKHKHKKSTKSHKSTKSRK